MKILFELDENKFPEYAKSPEYIRELFYESLVLSAHDRKLLILSTIPLNSVFRENFVKGVNEEIELAKQIFNAMKIL
jgi:hypothetical protein